MFVNKTIVIIFLGILCSAFVAFSQSLKRGPYLQIVSPNAITIRWESNESGFGKIRIGEKPDNLDQEIWENISLASHIFPFQNLKPDTKYYYSIELDGKILARDTTFYFRTAPEVNTKKKLRFAVFGDCGTLQPQQVEVANAVNNYFKGLPFDGMLLLGDNAYNSGFETEYQTNFFQIYDKFFLKNTPLWTSPGNHDYGDNRKWEQDHNGVKPAYYYIFSVPTNGESGGVPSYNQAYYSFDYGNVHFVSLDSYGLNGGKLMADTTSQLVDWLKKDLSANKSFWTVIFFHHPPYTKGSHNSDTEQELINIRQNFVKLIDQYDVDLVLNGHSHVYERSYPVTGFYGNSEDFSTSRFAISNSNGKYDGSVNSCVYVKEKKGTVYVVSGSSGWVGGISPGYPHKAMVYSNAESTGATILEFEDNRLDLKFISNTGVVLDKFSMMKSLRKESTYEIECGEKLTLKPSWLADSEIEGVKASGLSIDSLFKNVSFKIKDKKNCLSENINVKVKPLPKPVASSNSPIFQGQTLLLSGKGDSKGVLSWTGPQMIRRLGDEIKIQNTLLNQAGTYILESQYKFCVSYDSVQVDILKPLSIDNKPSENELILFPNPISNQIFLKTPGEEVSEIFISDNSGKNSIVDFKRFEAEQYIIEGNIQQLAGGNYFLIVNFKSGERRIVRFNKK